MASRALVPAVAVAVALSASPLLADAPAPSPPPSASAATPTGTTLKVTLSGFRNAKGQALIALYDSKEGWLDPKKAIRGARLKIEGNSVTTTWTGLSPGIYAVAAVHDENMNDKFDMHWFPFPGPDEGTACSNGATANMGPPKWSDARFQLTAAGGVLDLKLVY